MDKNEIIADKITTEYIDINSKKIKFTPEQKEALASALDSPLSRGLHGNNADFAGWRY